MNLPLISIICVVKNRVSTIRRCIDSVLSQDYPNVELVVQDGASTDGTLEALRAYGDRIRLESKPDNGAGEAIFRALNRCRGDLLGSCFSDEQLLPDALSWAQKIFEEDPDLGAIYGYVQNVDLNGKLLSGNDPGEFDLERLLSYDLIPPFPASFFRMDAIRQLGMSEYTGAGEHDLWFRMAVRFKIKYVHKLLAYYGQHPDCLSVRPDIHQAERHARIEALRRLFHEDPAGIRFSHLENRSLAGFHFKYALLSAQAGRWDLAEDHLDQAILSDPDFEWPALGVSSTAGQRSSAQRTRIFLNKLADLQWGPNIEKCLACHPVLNSSESRQLTRAWLRHCIRRPFNVWRPLHLSGIRTAAVFGASGWGQAIARDLSEIGIEVRIFVDNNSAFVPDAVHTIPRCTTEELLSCKMDVDAVISSILGSHDGEIMKHLQQNLAARAIPVISWKSLAYLFMDE